MSQKHKILLIEDDKGVRRLIKTTLASYDFSLTMAETAAAAFELLEETSFDLILLDLGLPDLDGCVFIERFRKEHLTPIVVISARTGEKDKIQALDLGADDYLTKPFGTGELLARIRSAIRRNQIQKLGVNALPNAVFRCGEIVMHYAKHEIYVSDEPVRLTQSEYKIFELLTQHAGKVLTYDFIMQALWNSDEKKDTQLLRVYMANIRRKIEKNPAMPQYLLTEVGVGYKFCDPERLCQA